MKQKTPNREKNLYTKVKVIIEYKTKDKWLNKRKEFASKYRNEKRFLRKMLKIKQAI